MLEEDYVLEFAFGQKQRLYYPGACALQYQDFVHILISDLLQWDVKKQQ